PRQPLLSRLGCDHSRRGCPSGVARRMGLRPRREGVIRGENRQRAGRVAPTRIGAVRLGRLRVVPLMATVRYLVTDVDRSVAFYVDQLGLEIVAHKSSAVYRR